MTLADVLIVAAIIGAFAWIVKGKKDKKAAGPNSAPTQDEIDAAERNGK